MSPNALFTCWAFFMFACFTAEATRCDLTSKSIDSISLIKELNGCGNTHAIEELDLSENNINELHTEYFSNFTNLRVLSINSNRLKRVPTDMNLYLSRLQTLSIMSNNIEDISGIRLDNITTLDVSNNNISFLHSSAFQGMPLLENLHLSRNHIQKISRKSFAGLSHLKKLHLDLNSLDTLYSNILAGLNKLEMISVAHNKLKRVRNNVFSDMPELSEIYLNNNQLDTLDEESFNGLNLNRIDLQNNQIKRFKGSVFRNTKIYGKVNIRSNPLYCDCWLIDPVLLALREKGEIQGSCRGPVMMRGKNIIPLTHDQLVCKKIDSCNDHLCQNEATCKHVNETYYECECVPGYLGNRCEIAVNEDNTVMIILCVCLGVVLVAAIVIGGVVYARKKRNHLNRCISKEVCCCFLILTVFFFLFALFVGLRVACKFHEYC